MLLMTHRRNGLETGCLTGVNIKASCSHLFVLALCFCDLYTSIPHSSKSRFWLLSFYERPTLAPILIPKEILGWFLLLGKKSKR